MEDSSNRHLLLLLLHLVLLLLLASFPSNMANWDNNVNIKNPSGNPTTIETKYWKKDQTKKGDSNNVATPTTPHGKEDQINKGHGQLSTEENKVLVCPAEFGCQCPTVCECPITVEPEVFKQLKHNVAPVIHRRLEELLSRTLTIESATEAAHTIDLLTLIDESNSELKRIRDNVHEGAKMLRAAFEEIPNHIHK